MKKILILIAANFIAVTAFSQFIHKIKADSVLITNDSCNAELNLENSTKSVKGFLYNKGNGRTEFRKGIIKVDDTTYVIGNDTLNPCACLAKIKAANGLTAIGDTIKLGGDLQNNTVINLKDKRITFNLSDASGAIAPSAGITISGARTAYNGGDFLYIQSFHRPTTAGGGISSFLETFWEPTNTISGVSGYTNYYSVQKSNMANINMPGSHLYGFRSSFRVLQTNQIFGNMYHFYGSALAGATLTGMTNHYGLYLEPLKLPNSVGTYAIYTSGTEDSIYNAGPVRFPKYKNNLTEDSVLTTDQNGNLKLKLAAGGGGGTGWSLTGNTGINPATNFLGTTDAQPLIFKTNSAEAARVAANGEVYVANTTDQGNYQLQVGGSIWNNANIHMAATSPILSFYLGTGAGSDYWMGRSSNSLIISSASILEDQIGNNSWYNGSIANGHRWYDGAVSPAVLMQLKTDGEFLIGTGVDNGAYRLQTNTPASGNAFFVDASVNAGIGYKFKAKDQAWVWHAENGIAQVGLQNQISGTQWTLDAANTTLNIQGRTADVKLITDASGDIYLNTGRKLKINLGSDATGDLYYRNSTGDFTRLPIGTAGQVLTVTAGLLPSWAAAGGGGGAPGGSNGQVQFNNSGVFGGSTNLFWDNTNNRLGIATASPQYQLDVTGDARITSLPFLASRDTVLTYDPSTKQMMSTKISAGPSSVKLTADLAANTATALADATGLSFSVNANTYYHFKFLVVYSTAATTTGIRLSVSIPASPTVFSAKASIPIAADGAGGEFQGWITASNDAVIGTGVQAANTNYVAIVEGTILTGATGGTVQLRYATEVAGSGVTIKRASFGQLTVY